MITGRVVSNVASSAREKIKGRRKEGGERKENNKKKKKKETIANRRTGKRRSYSHGKEKVKALNTALEAPVPEPIAGNRRLLGDVKVETKLDIVVKRQRREDVENRGGGNGTKRAKNGNN